MIIIVFGLPGSGKSYFASRLAARLNADYISSDKIRMAMFPQRTYGDAETKAVYKRMLEEMNRHAADHTDVVLDATFHKNDIRRMFQRTGKAIFIEITADEKLIEERLTGTRPYSEADIHVYHRLMAESEPLTEDHLTLRSTDGNVDLLLKEALKYLANKR